ncbi:DUF1848 domain-containing protein [Ruminococcaceae bacterium OttesenSCG-928-D13]|nr:DUF1848 domain-containing protein [Ruminococcaceae bacterium OttesenSCG-928-D13]
MILSVSRRTDVPRLFFDWFLNRLTAGEALVRGPMNHSQVSRVPLTPEVLDCIVFWSKNPAPMLGRLAELAPYPWYLQFTLHPYGPEIEASLPGKAELLDTFKALAEAAGPGRVVWRYSPVLLNAAYTTGAHLAFFEQTARALEGYTQSCRLSFLDFYPKIQKRMAALGAQNPPLEEKVSLAARLAEIGAASGIVVRGCSDPALVAAGLGGGGCVDAALVSRLVGQPLNLGKDPGQRPECLCAASVDIGAYNTCANGCAYCYANHSPASVAAAMKRYDPAAPMLCGALGPGDRVTDRAVKSHRAADGGQLSFL